MERCLHASDDEWFAERFRKDVPPVLSLNNSVLPDYIIKWWQVLVCFSFDTSAHFNLQWAGLCAIQNLIENAFKLCLKYTFFFSWSHYFSLQCQIIIQKSF